MGDTTGISWADHTFNPWIGCTKVSEACRNCYAERDNGFRKWNGGTWGPGAPRKVTSESNWRKPILWNHRAIVDGVRRRVFCASLADVFDSEAPIDAQVRLFDLIEECAALDWLLLTKRPENALAFSRERRFPENVWIGTSVENQAAADLRIPILLQIEATVRFVSMEPLLGPVDLRHVQVAPPPANPWGIEPIAGPVCEINSLTGDYIRGRFGYAGGPTIQWVICGGESGPKARPSHPDWFRSLRDQCVDADVAFHFKQWGEWTPGENVERATGRVAGATMVDGGWILGTENLAARDGHVDDEPTLYRVGKAAAGRLVDGVEWNEFPEAAYA